MAHPESRTARLEGRAEPEYFAEPAASPVEAEFTVNTRAVVPEQAVYRTVVLSSVNPFSQLTGRDPGKFKLLVIALSNPVYLCESPEMAMDVVNYVVNLSGTDVYTSGAYIPVGVPVPLENTGPLYAAVSTTESVSPVAVIVQRFGS